MANTSTDPSRNNNPRPLLMAEIGSDGIARESPVIAYTEKIIEEEQLQLRKYIEENYSKIRDVERELTNLTMEMKLTAGPKKAALEHLRKKIEQATERIRLAKLNEDQAQKAWDEASNAVKEEEAIKRKLCDDLNNLVQESSNSQFARLEELKRRLEALNPSRSSSAVRPDTNSAEPSNSTTQNASLVAAAGMASKSAQNTSNQGNSGDPTLNGQNQQASSLYGDGRGKKRNNTQGRGKGLGAVPQGRSSATPGWTGSGFDVDGRN